MNAPLSPRLKTKDTSFNLFKNQYLTVKYHITTDCDPASLSRVLELFALRGMIPSHVRSNKYNDDLLSIEIHITNVTDKEAQVILEKLHAQILVRFANIEVLLSKSLPKSLNVA
jgi:hypothetical protein